MDGDLNKKKNYLRKAITSVAATMALTTALNVGAPAKKVNAYSFPEVTMTLEDLNDECQTEDKAHSFKSDIWNDYRHCPFQGDFYKILWKGS